MSDFLSVILYVLDNEVDAFWSFVALMKKLVGVVCQFLHTIEEITFDA